MRYPSFEVFYAEAADDCFRAVAVAVGNGGDAADLVHEAFTRAFTRWPEVATHPSPIAWVIRTAMNLHRDRWRRATRGVRGFGDGRKFIEPSLPTDPRLLEALLALPRRQREVVALRVIADLDTRQAAAVLGTAEATVRVHLHRALKALRASLIEEELR